MSWFNDTRDGASRRQFLGLAGGAGALAVLPINFATLRPAYAAGKTLTVRIG